MKIPLESFQPTQTTDFRTRQLQFSSTERVTITTYLTTIYIRDDHPCIRSVALTLPFFRRSKIVPSVALFGMGGWKSSLEITQMGFLGFGTSVYNISIDRFASVELHIFSLTRQPDPLTRCSHWRHHANARCYVPNLFFPVISHFPEVRCPCLSNYGTWNLQQNIKGWGSRRNCGRAISCRVALPSTPNNDSEPHCVDSNTSSYIP